MKTTPIPAQVTTVEDKIAANLSLTQLILLLAPLFISVFVFAVLPERMYFNPYKIILIALSLVIFLTLAIRVKERIVLNWLILLVAYYLRPHLFVFDKNDDYLREEEPQPDNEVKNAVNNKQIPAKKEKKNHLSVLNLIQLENLINARNTEMLIKFGQKRRLRLNRF
ncbi:MAG TPA: hypothetical protein VMY36_03780 [Patescibacteria group bacterium]|nr:hypothetical protein [Patescibacteria group bacterium]